MKRLARWWLAAGATALIAVLLVPAAADWLVTREGDRIETLGPWKVESRLVVFKRPDGTLASLRLSEVDLQASERLTLEMQAKAEAPPSKPEPRQRPVIARLTEKELPSVGALPESLDGAPADEGMNAETAAGRSEPQPLEIATWRELFNPAGEGLEFTGTVRNRSENMAVGVAVVAELFDEADEGIASSTAVLTSNALPPGQSAGFRVSFPGRFHYSRVEFRVTGDLLLTPPPEGSGEEEGGGR